MTTPSKLSTKILQYRNGIYQGQVKGNKRHGQGILITDDNTIIVSQWKNDLMSGKGFIYLGPQQYGYGQFNRGQIQGYFIFRLKNKTLFSQFNLSRPINKMVFMNYQTNKLQTIAHKAPIFQVLGQKNLGSVNQQQAIFSTIGVRFPCYSLLDYLYKQICQGNQSKSQQKQTNYNNNKINKLNSMNSQISKIQQQNYFHMKSLNNGNILFYFEDETNPSYLGFCLNKNEQLVSCGMYVNDKLTGLGCKYQNAIRYQGMFQGGFVNGIGLKYNQGKYSFGQFQNGNLIQAMFIDDRSTISQQKLKQFKKFQHIRSIWYQNSYIRRNLIKFKGITQLIFQINTQQQYMYPQINTMLNMGLKKQSPIKSINNAINQNTYIQANNSRVNNSKLNKSNSKNLALNMLMKRQGDKLQTKSSKQFFVRPNQGDNKNQRKFNNNNNVGNINTRTSIDNNQRMNNTGDIYYKNPEDDQDLMNNQGRSVTGVTGLKNLRKFKY